MNDERHSYDSINFKSFRSVPGIGDKDQICFLLSPYICMYF